MSALNVAVVSAYGRGHWLASEMQKQGLQVQLVDVTSLLGQWSPEDFEGPFGFFEPEHIQGSQVTSLIEGDYHDPVENGFCLWLKSGPVDLKSSLSTHHLQALGIPESTKEYINQYHSLSPHRVEELLNEARESQFEKSWLACLAHHFGANRSLSSLEALGYGNPMPLFSRLNLRRVTRRGMAQSLTWCADQGVRVYSKLRIKGMDFTDGRVEALRIDHETHEKVECDSLIWMLSSEETEFLNPEISISLFPEGPISSEWSWIRFRFQADLRIYKHIVPIYFAIIEDIHLPWYHNNFVVVHRAVNETDLDAWIRIPSHKRFQRGYLSQLARDLEASLAERLPTSEVDLLEMPKEMELDSEKAGVSPFAIYRSEDLRRLSPAKISNIVYDGPEYWSRLDWTGRFEHQMDLVEREAKTLKGLESQRSTN